MAAKSLSPVGLDTSVVLRLLLGEPEAQANAAMNYLTQRRVEGAPPALVSDLVVSESFFALQHHYAVPRASALAALRRLIDDPYLQVSPASVAVLQTSGGMAARPGFPDRIIHEQYRLQGSSFVTFDRHAGRLPGTILLGS